MSLRIKTLTTFTLVALTIGLFSQTASAVDCQKVKANLSGGGGSGIITRGGRLNGTTQAVFTSMFMPTPDPTTFSFTDDLTLTTEEGVLITHNVAIFDVARGVFGAINQIDADNSKGIFEGATGVLYINGSTPDGGATIRAQITGEVCYAD